MYLYDWDVYNPDKDGGHHWRSLCEGDKRALSSLFRIYYGRLFDYGIKIISNEDVVKDAIQELFLNLWKTHNTLSRALESVEAYLLVSLRRILIRRISQDQNRLERNRKYLDNIFTVSLTVEDMMIRKELDEEIKEELVKAINRLNSKQKETLFLRYYHGLTNTEIAEVMQINRQSVKNNLSRSLRSLRILINTAPHFE